MFLDTCRRIVKCLNIVRLEILRLAFKTSPAVQQALAISDECWFQGTNYGSRHKSASSVASASGNIYPKPGLSHYVPYGYLIAE
jgi:hypothetical protein